MARVDVATQKIVGAGLNPVLTAPTVDGDVVDAGMVALYVKNDGAGVCNVTQRTPQQAAGLDVAERVTAVPVGQFRLIGPFPAATFAQQAGVDAGRVYVDYSIQAGVTRGAVGF